MKEKNQKHKCPRCECFFDDPEDAEGCCAPVDGVPIKYCGGCHRHLGQYTMFAKNRKPKATHQE